MISSFARVGYELRLKGQAHPELGERMKFRGVLSGGAGAVDAAQPGLHDADASVVQREAAIAAALTTWGEKNLDHKRHLAIFRQRQRDRPVNDHVQPLSQLLS